MGDHPARRSWNWRPRPASPWWRGRIQPFDLYNADEIFLSSTAGGIFAVGELDGRTIGDGRMGPVTRQMRDGYQALLESGAKSTPVC